MKPRVTLILLALTLALGAYIYFYERHTGATGAAAVPGRILPGLNSTAVSTLQIYPLGHPEIGATRKLETWQLTQPITATAAAPAIEQLLQTLTKLTWRTRLTAEDLKTRPNAALEFGFAPPQSALTIRQGDRKFQLALGNRTALGDEIFVQTGSGEIYVVAADLLKLFPRTVSEWRDPALLNLKHLAFDRIIVTNGAKVFELQRDRTNQLWRLTRPLEARADNPKIASLLQQLETLRASQFVTDDPKADLEPYGLQPAALTITLAQADAPVLVLQFGKSPTNHPGQIFFHRADQTGVSLVAGELLAPWRGAHEDFRDRHLALLPAEIVDAIELRGPAGFTLQRTSNDVWRVTAPENLPADTALVREFLGGISSLQVTQFVKAVVTEPDLPNYGLAPAARSLLLKSAGGETGLQLDFSAPQNGKTFARRSDETSVYAVRTEDMRRFRATGWQFRERRLWDFTEDEVTRLVLEQRGDRRELLRRGTNHWEFAAGSQGLINTFAVEEAVHRLGELTADTWMDRGAAARSDYGFTNDPVILKLTVKRDGQTNDYSLDFSGATPGRPPYGAITLEGQPWIFEVNPDLGDLIRNYLMLPPNP